MWGWILFCLHVQFHEFLVALSGMGGRQVRSVLLSSFRVLGHSFDLSSVSLRGEKGI